MDSESKFILWLCERLTNSRITTCDPCDLKFNEERLYKLCFYHQIVPFISQFEEQSRDAFPTLSNNFFQKIKQYAAFNRARFIAYKAFYKTLRGELQKADIDYIIFKGIANSLMLYERPESRSFSDLDILILPDSLDDVRDILLNMGFFLDEGLYSHFPDEIVRKYSFARHFIRHEKTELMVDVHLNLSGKLHPFQFEVGDFWNNTRILQRNDISIRTFSDEYLSVYMLYHAFKHYYFRLIWFFDTFQVFDKLALDCDKVEILLQKYHLTRIMNMFLNISTRIFGRLPKSVANSALERFHTTEQHKIVNRDSVLRGMLPFSQSWVRIILPLYYLPSLRSKLRFLSVQLFPPREAIEDFYIDETIKPSFTNYMRLRYRTLKMNFKEILF